MELVKVFWNRILRIGKFCIVWLILFGVFGVVRGEVEFVGVG